MSIFGAILCLPWFAAYLRNSDYYIFRMAQAKKLGPKKWDLISKSGKRFSKGKTVKINNKCYRVRFLGRILRTKRAVPFLIFAFLTLYMLTIVLTGPWWCK